MPPLISLETSPLKYDGSIRTSDIGRLSEREYNIRTRTDDSNVIQFSSPDHFRRDAVNESPERETDPEPGISYVRQLFENSPAAIVLLDTYDHVIDLNPAFTKIFQYTLEEIKNLPVTDFIVPKGHMREAIEMTLKTLRGEPILQTLQRKRKDGLLVDVELTAYPIKLQGNRIGIYTIYTDVSEKNLMQERTHQCEKFQSLGMLAGGTAREVNAVLGILMAGIKQLELGTSEGGPCAKTYQEMNAAIDRGVELVGQLLAFAGRASVHPEKINADTAAREIKAMLQSVTPA
jgi:PAS domain S-box-containing protein